MEGCNDLVKTAEYLRLFIAVVEQIMKMDKVCSLVQMLYVAPHSL